MVKAVRKALKIDRREQHDTLAGLAEEAAAANRLSELYAIIRKLSPKSIPPRVALKHPSGRKCLDHREENEVFGEHVRKA